MQEHAAGSVVVLALLSPDYFTSKFCRGELEGAKEAGVPIVPVFSGDHYTRKSIIDLMEQKADPEKKEAVKAAFGENLIDVNNGDHADEVNRDIGEKIVGRFCAEALPEGSLRSPRSSSRTSRTPSRTSQTPSRGSRASGMSRGSVVSSDV